MVFAKSNLKLNFNFYRNIKMKKTIKLIFDYEWCVVEDYDSEPYAGSNGLCYEFVNKHWHIPSKVKEIWVTVSTAPLKEAVKLCLFYDEYYQMGWTHTGEEKPEYVDKDHDMFRTAQYTLEDWHFNPISCLEDRIVYVAIDYEDPKNKDD